MRECDGVVDEREGRLSTCLILTLSEGFVLWVWLRVSGEGYAGGCSSHWNAPEYLQEASLRRTATWKSKVYHR